MSCAVIRSVSPDLRTLPSTTASTPSSSPISCTVIFFPFSANTEVRAGTFSPFTLTSALISSSVMPSLKYSFSLVVAHVVERQDGDGGRRRAAAGTGGAAPAADQEREAG